MKRTELSHLLQKSEQFAQEKVTVCGWVRTLRNSKKIGFLELNDGSAFQSVQVVLDQDTLSNFDEIIKLNVGASVEVLGTVVLTPGAKQTFEIQADMVRVEGNSTPDYPLQKKRHSMEFLREIAHLRPRTNTFNAVFRVRSELAFAIHRYFHDNGFVWVHTPIITGSDAEGAGEMFHVSTLDQNNLPRTKEGEIDYTQDFFGKETSLTVSGQLEAEAYALAFGKVYTFGPTFRAENSNTARHAAEFWMIEPEIAFADLNDDMALAQDMLQSVLRDILKNCPSEIDFFNQFYDNTLKERLTHLADSDFAHLTYTQAIEELEKHKEEFDYPVFWGCDLQTEHERYLTEKICGCPVFITDYPKEIKAFYMRMNEDGKTVAAMDLLVAGIGELIGGSQREERLDRLEARMEECGLSQEDYEWYLQLRKYGGTQHAGFGLGFERLVMYVTGISNIRDVLPFPRTPGSAEF